MHQAVGNSLCVLKQWMPPNHLDDAHLLVDTALANTMYTTRATFHSGLVTTPGALSFGRDIYPDLTLIHYNRQMNVLYAAMHTVIHMITNLVKKF
jgi:hypothetical protein